MTALPRISFLGANRAAQSRLRDSYALLEQANARVSTGRAYTRPSESPAAASRAAILQDQLDQLTVFGRAADDATSRLAIADNKLTEAMDLYHRVTELATQGAHSLTNPGARMSVRAEVLQVRDSLVAIANSTYLGQGLFSGLAGGNAVTYVAPAWVFTGTASDQITRHIGPTEDVRVNTTASEVFSDGTTDVFTVLDDLAAALAADDTAGIQAALPAITTLRASLSAAQAQLGSSANRVEQAKARNAAITVTLTSEIAQVRDVDLADAITDQQRRQVAYEAALGVTAKAMTASLLDWLR